MKQYILFDLDGTLTDPKEGITTCVQYALKSFGIDEPDLDKLEPFIGPPLKDSFMKYYNMSEEDAVRAVDKYRERFQEKGIFENELYPGIHDLLRTLKGGGMHLAVASSKPTVFVERILKHFKIDQYFEVVVGSELNGERVEKAQVVQEVLHRFFPGGQPRYDEVFMVGDRKFDIEGARTFRIETVGVTYGYGSMEELKEARADYIVGDIQELKKLLLREVEEIRRKMEESGQTAAGQRRRPVSNKMLWKMLLAVVIFYVMKMVGTNIMSSALQALGKQMPVLQDLLFVKDSASEVVQMTGNAYVICQITGFAAASFMILKMARSAILKTADEERLVHLTPEPLKNYLLLAAAVLGSVIGLNILITVTGMAEGSEAYQAAMQQQYSSNIVLGLLCYGVAAPIAEELIFRGVIYNCLRRIMKPGIAMLLCAFAFSGFHGNTVQIVYSFVIGLLIAYAYEFFGSFYVPVAIHMVANIAVYLMNVSGIGSTAFVSEPVAGVALAIAVGGFLLLEKQKKLFDFGRNRRR